MVRAPFTPKISGPGDPVNTVGEVAVLYPHSGTLYPGGTEGGAVPGLLRPLCTAWSHYESKFFETCEIRGKEPRRGAPELAR